jgi:Rad3-related DNA helicase
MYKQIYEFAASAGALEGYVYCKETLSEAVIAKWCDNLLNAYNRIPPEARQQFQTSCDQTLGRAIRSLLPLLGEDHDIIGKLRSMIAGQLPASADDFNKDKGF